MKNGGFNGTFVSTSEARQVLGVSNQTLRNMSENGLIQCIRKPFKGSHRYYNITDFIEKNRNRTDDAKSVLEDTKRCICYCRVSSKNQKDDLERQIEYMRSAYPNYEIITDIGSGLNFARKGLKTILDEAIRGNIQEIVVAHKDRLCRFGFEIIEHIIKTYSKGRILVLNHTNLSPESELAKDVLQILTVFSARINGLRKYRRKFKKEEENKRNDQKTTSS